MNIQDSSLAIQLNPSFAKMLEGNSTHLLNEQKDDMLQGVDTQRKSIADTLDTSQHTLNAIVETQADVAKQRVEDSLDTTKHTLKMQIDTKADAALDKIFTEADTVELYAQHQKEKAQLTYDKDLQIHKSDADFISIYA